MSTTDVVERWPPAAGAPPTVSPSSPRRRVTPRATSSPAAHFHLSAFPVPNGTQVAQGQQIGVTLAPYPSSYGSRSIISNNCPCVIQGDIKAKSEAVNGPVLLGACTAGEPATPDGVGRFNHFERGSIYWTQTTGAHEVHGPIRAKWESLGWETGALGYPVRGWGRLSERSRRR